jgi:CshA-type fibril repeat protein
MTLTVAGEGTWTVEADDTITFAPEPGFLTDPGVVYYRVIDTTGDAASATITVTYLPQATNNSSLGHAAGTTVNVDVLGNDSGSFVLNSMRVIDPGTTLPVTTLVVAGEGEWRANADGTITFVPEAGFYADPTPIDYEVTDVTGDRVRAQLRLAYVPVAALNQSSGNVLGAPAVIDPLANDTGTFDPTSVRIVDPGTLLPVTTLLVPGEGQWDVDALTGVITFTPAPGFVGNPTTITYQVTDITGDTVQATITVSYLPQAVDDEKLGNPQGDPVEVLVLPNDLGSFAPGTARLLSGATPMMTLTVPGEGTWQMNAPLARVTFTPLAGFTADPTPVPYRVTDVNGNTASANVTITYLRVSGLAYTGLEAPQQLAGALGAIALGLIGVAFARLRRVTARHRA